MLDEELETYEREKRGLLKEAAGKYVLIKGKAVLGTFDTQVAAIHEGWRLFGHVPIFTREIIEVDVPLRMERLAL